MKYKEVIFYNHYGCGDLWASRQIVQEMMEILEAENYYYAHSHDHHLFFDIPTLQFKPLDELCNMRMPYVIYGDSLYINTWIGYAYGKYVFPNVS
ncbi:MAG TPA: hypothetical protein PLC53_04100, partial [Bacilli bacterium]|nr:hypothetical protein [Bacilli bacterium]